MNSNCARTSTARRLENVSVNDRIDFNILWELCDGGFRGNSSQVRGREMSEFAVECTERLDGESNEGME